MADSTDPLPAAERAEPKRHVDRLTLPESASPLERRLQRWASSVVSGVGRQFDSRPTRAQIVFDFLVGVVCVPLGLVFDPGMFNSYEMGVGGGYQLLARTTAAVAVPALCIWLTFGRRVSVFSAGLGVIFFVAGLLCATLLFALTLVYPVLPIILFSMPVLFVQVALGGFGVGPQAGENPLLLGLSVLAGAWYAFLPFAATFICFRNGVRALRFSLGNLRPAGCLFSLLGLVPAVLVVGPIAAHGYVQGKVAGCMKQAGGGDAGVRGTIEQLKELRWLGLATFDPMVYAVTMKNHSESYNRGVSEAYKEITGMEIMERWAKIGN
jgi:hypothetical protein